MHAKTSTYRTFKMTWGGGGGTRAHFPVQRVTSGADGLCTVCCHVLGFIMGAQPCFAGRAATSVGLGCTCSLLTLFLLSRGGGFPGPEGCIGWCRVPGQQCAASLAHTPGSYIVIDRKRKAHVKCKMGCVAESAGPRQIITDTLKADQHAMTV